MKITTQQYAEIIVNKVAELSKTIAKQGGKVQEDDSDVQAAMIVTFAQEMMYVMGQVDKLTYVPQNQLLH